MNPYLEKLLYFTSGLLFGGIFGSIYVRYKYEKKMDKLVDDIYNSERKDISLPEQKEEQQIPVPVEIDIEELVHDVTQNNDYDQMVHFAERKAPEENVTLPKKESPYIITARSFNEDNYEYDKLTLYYYAVDDTLSDEMDEVVQDPDKLVGESTLSSFGLGSDDENIVYARNDQISCDFEICRLNQSYAEMICGIIPYKKSNKESKKGKNNEEE